MFQVAIVEDDVQYRDQLEAYIRKYETESGESFGIRMFSDGDEIVDHYAGNYDIIFLDIEMRRLNGMEAARIIRSLDREVILIFITNMAQYAIQGYEVEAMDYVLKPIRYFAFSQEMEKAVKRLKAMPRQVIRIEQDQGVMLLNAQEISWMESQGHNIIIHKGEETWSVRMTMKEMEADLQESGFARCNSGYLVNLAFVKKVDHGEVYVGDVALPISRSRRRDFMEKLTNYLGSR